MAARTPTYVLFPVPKIMIRKEEYGENAPDGSCADGRPAQGDDSTPPRHSILRVGLKRRSSARCTDSLREAPLARQTKDTPHGVAIERRATGSSGNRPQVNKAWARSPFALVWPCRWRIAETSVKTPQTYLKPIVHRLHIHPRCINLIDLGDASKTCNKRRSETGAKHAFSDKTPCFRPYASISGMGHDIRSKTPGCCSDPLPSAESRHRAPCPQRHPIDGDRNTLICRRTPPSRRPPSLSHSSPGSR